ncbi:hypothetical protein Riv7116_4010 [Rivularia sp. PCC 7116]|uniref:hypothetical protein n=1 Tax=Rivularia sp. PCC 7116 TaxID=373994 RepID=UPI00029F00BF|nr:hypothetical protein [Rivularia sp. PCC 7116]AFY56450.1 hypothetical protein Riv7116_4010 [Rivularia sp. PCC 7116]
MTTNKFSPLFRLILKALKYFMFIVLGFTFAACLSGILGTSHIAISLFPLVFECIWRSGIVLIGLAGASVVIESFR